MNNFDEYNVLQSWEERCQRELKIVLYEKEQEIERVHCIREYICKNNVDSLSAQPIAAMMCGLVESVYQYTSTTVG